MKGDGNRDLSRYIGSCPQAFLPVSMPGATVAGLGSTGARFTRSGADPSFSLSPFEITKASCFGAGQSASQSPVRTVPTYIGSYIRGHTSRNMCVLMILGLETVKEDCPKQLLTKGREKNQYPTSIPSHPTLTTKLSRIDDVQGFLAAIDFSSSINAEYISVAD